MEKIGIACWGGEGFIEILVFVLIDFKIPMIGNRDFIEQFLGMEGNFRIKRCEKLDVWHVSLSKRITYFVNIYNFSDKEKPENGKSKDYTRVISSVRRVSIP